MTGAGSPRRRFLQHAISIGVLALCGWFCVGVIHENWEAVRCRLDTSIAGAVVLAAAALCASIGLLAYRFQLILSINGMRPGFPLVLRQVAFSCFAETFLPTKVSGDVVRYYQLHHMFLEREHELVSILLFDRYLVGMGGLLLLFLGGVAFNLGQDWPREALRQIDFGAPGPRGDAFLLFSGLAGAAVALGYMGWRRNWGGMRARVPAAMALLRRMCADTRFPAILGLSVLHHSVYVLVMYALASAVGIGSPVGFYFVCVPLVVTLGSFFPSPGGLGGMEVGFYVLFTRLQREDGALVLTMVVLYRLASFLSVLPGLLGRRTLFGLETPPPGE